MRKLAFLRFLSLLFLTACAGIADEDSDALQPVSFSVIPSVNEDAGSGGLITTRAKVDGTFAAGSQVGLGIAGSSINNIYANFFAQYSGTDWLYYLGGINNGTLLSGFASWGTISIYGYYPYSSAVNNLAQVPFRIASVPVGGVSYATDDDVQTDYMVAATKTKDMNNASGSTVSLAFGHLMTSIELSVRRQSYSGALPMIKLDKVVYEISGGSRSFGVAGTYTAKGPNMTNMSDNIFTTESANRLEVTYLSSANITSTSYTSRLLIIFPELRQTTGSGGADDATVKLTFYFADQDGTHYAFEDIENPSVSFNLSAISNGSGTDNGLLAGYTYTIQATIGTYTKFMVPIGPTVIDNSLDETPPVFIEI